MKFCHIQQQCSFSTCRRQRVLRPIRGEMFIDQMIKNDLSRPVGRNVWGITFRSYGARSFDLELWVL
jgi:hypothetical protein